MEELFLLMTEIKAQALVAFWLTISEIDIPECGDNNNTSTEEGRELADIDSRTKNAEIELFLTRICQISSTEKQHKCRTKLQMAKDNSGLP